MPIAKNSKNGKDCPKGRRFNRRVEIFIMDKEGNVLNALVSPFEIPNDLIYEAQKTIIRMPKDTMPVRKVIGMN